MFFQSHTVYRSEYFQMTTHMVTYWQGYIWEIGPSSPKTRAGGMGAALGPHRVHWSAKGNYFKWVLPNVWFKSGTILPLTCPNVRPLHSPDGLSSPVYTRETVPHTH